MASLPYVQQLSRIIVAQISQNIGWNSIQTIPLELMGDILHKYLHELTRQIHRYSELYGRTEPNLDDVALAFHDLNIQLSDLDEYISNVDPVPCATEVPKFPIAKESHLNFLKPGSKEVVTRPVHIHEHLPPIYPDKEEQMDTKPNIHINHNINNNNVRAQYSMDMNQLLNMSPPSNEEEIINGGMDNVQQETVIAGNSEEVSPFKKPTDAHMRSNAAFPLDGSNTENMGRPTREILSCIMTTSGFISPAREGKLPEARKPINIPDDPPSPPPLAPVKGNNGMTSQNSNDTGTTKSKAEKNSGSTKGGDSNATNTADGNKLKNSSESKKLLLAGVPKEKNTNKKRKLLLMQSKERKKAKKELRLLQNADANSIMTPNTKNKHSNQSQNQLAANNLPPYPQDIPDGNMLLLPSFNEGTSKTHDIENTLPPTPQKKGKKIGERKHKLDKNETTASEPGATNPDKQRKKKIPKLSKKKLAAAAAAAATAAALQPYPDMAHVADSNMTNSWFNDEQNSHHQLSKLGGLPHTPRGGTPLLGASFDSSAYKYTDPVPSIPYDSTDPNKYYQSQQPALYKNTDKLSTEPDKRKLNIFKKISSSASSTDPSGSSKKSKKAANGVANIPVNPSNKYNDFAQIGHHHPLALNDSVDIIPLNMTMGNAELAYGAQSLHSQSLPVTPTSKKQKIPKAQRDPNLKKQLKIPKIPKEKKPKKELSPKKQRQPKTPKMKSWPLKEDSSDAAAVAAAVAAVGGPARAPYLFPNLLDQFSGPGLIPTNPLFQSVPFGLGQPGPHNPFQPLPAFDMLNFPPHFKRNPFGDPNALHHMNEINQPDSAIKPQCNVAPLVPSTSKFGNMFHAQQQQEEQYLYNQQQRPQIHYTARDAIDTAALGLDVARGLADTVRGRSTATSSRQKGHKSSHVHAEMTSTTINISDDDDYGHRKHSREIKAEKIDVAYDNYEHKPHKQKDIDKQYDAHDNEDEKHQISQQRAHTNAHIETDSQLMAHDLSMGVSERPSTPKSSIKSEHKKKDKSGHKKERKDKDGKDGIKLKKKKDKKDKSKSKSDKRAMKEALKNKELKDRSAAKKEKRERKKVKERLAAASALATSSGNDDLFSSISVKDNASPYLSNSLYGNDEPSSNTAESMDASSAIPKLTLKLGPSTSSSPRPATPDIPPRKITIKSMKKKKRRASGNDSEKVISDNDYDDNDYGSRKNVDDHEERYSYSKRDPSPELARISALVTHPPKEKKTSSRNSTSLSAQAKSSSMDDSGLDYSELHTSTQSKSRSSLSPAVITGTNNYGPKILSRNSSPLPGVPPTTPTTSGRGRPKGSTNSAKAAKNRQHKTSGTSGQNTNHPSIVVTPSLSSVSQLIVPTTLPKSPSSSGHQDAEGNQVWICPACGHMDDGTPMIGCDGCDAWYHWVCVGIQVAPDQDQDWYCRVCILKKQEGDKKKKRKKKDKKEH